MFKSEKICDDAADYVCNHEDYDIVRSWEHYYMARDYVNKNYYKNLEKECEYYKEIMNF